MAYKETIKLLKDLLFNIKHDLEKAEGGNKAAAQRVRTGTVKLEKVAKVYRKESIKNERSGSKPVKRAVKKAHIKVKAHKAKTAVKAKAKVASFRPKAKAHALKTHKTIAKPRALSFKKPSAKLPIRRASAR